MFPNYVVEIQHILFKKFQNKNKVDIWFDPMLVTGEFCNRKPIHLSLTPAAHFLLQAEIQKYMIHNNAINEFK